MTTTATGATEPGATEAGATEAGTTGTDTFEYKDPKTGTLHTIPAKTVDGTDIQSLLNRASEAGRIAATQKEKARYRELNELMEKKDLSLSELQDQIVKIEEERMTADERAQAQYSRDLDKAKQLASDSKSVAEKNFSLYRENKISNDLYAAFAGHELSNIDQAMLILRSTGMAELVEVDGTFTTVLRMNVDDKLTDMSPTEAVKKWVALPENSHFIKNNLRPGSGTSDAGAGLSGDGVMQYTRSSMADAKTRKEYTDKMRLGEKVVLIEG